MVDIVGAAAAMALKKMGNIYPGTQILVNGATSGFGMFLLQGYESAKQIMKSKALFLNPTPRPIEIPTSLVKNLFTRKKHIALLTASCRRNAALFILVLNS